MQQITVKLTDAIRATPHTTSLGSFTIKKSLIFGSTAVALQRYPYPSKSIIHIAYCKLLEFLNVRIFIFDGNRKALAPAFYTINRSIRHTYIWELLSTLPIPIGAAIKHLNDLTALFAAGLEYRLCLISPATKTSKSCVPQHVSIPSIMLLSLSIVRWVILKYGRIILGINSMLLLLKRSLNPANSPSDRTHIIRAPIEYLD